MKNGPFWYINPGMDKEFANVSIPASLHKKIEEFIKGTEFKSVSSYVAKVLRDSLTAAEKPAAEAFSKDEEEKVKERLKALGYID